MITQFLINIIIAAVWMLLQEALTWENFVVGYFLGFAILYFTVGRLQLPPYTKPVIAFAKLSWVFFIEVIKSTVRVVYLVLHPRLPVSPGLITVPLDVKSDEGITMLAGLITMTPGTLSVEVSADRAFLYVHALEADDPEGSIKEFKEVFERRVMEVYK